MCPRESFPDREEAGTPNIAGAIALATVLYTLKKIGMDFIDDEETALVRYAIEELSRIDDVVIYGQTDTDGLPSNRRGFHQHPGYASFAHRSHSQRLLQHRRSQCVLLRPSLCPGDDHRRPDGARWTASVMKNWRHWRSCSAAWFRASFGIYNTREDVDALVAALAGYQ